MSAPRLFLSLSALGGNIQAEGNWANTEATGWNTLPIDMFVAVPATGHIWEMRFVEYPKVLPLGESVPLRAALVDKLSGITNEDCTITYSTQDNWYNCHYENGLLHALATIDNFPVSAQTQLEDDDTVYKATVNVTVPTLSLARYTEVGHWDVNTTVPAWWKEEPQTGIFPELAAVLNKPMVGIKITYTQKTAARAWNQALLRINWDEQRFWHIGPGGRDYNPDEQIEAVGFFADGFDHINQWIYNMNDCVIDRITVYWPIIGTSVFVR